MRGLIVGNWKLYVHSLSEGKKLLHDIDKKFPRGVKADVVVAPQVPLAATLRTEYGGRRIGFGTQDASFDAEGAHTGSVSPLSLKSSGIDYVILGHAEMRERGDTDEIVSKKAAAALSAKLHPIICVGEATRDEEGGHFSFLSKNVTQSLARVDGSYASKLTVAYDPLWAIGVEEPPAAHVVREGIVFIRKTLADMWDREAALKTRIIYGGSVTPESARILKEDANVQGFLVGRASIDAHSFTGIIRAFS